MYLWCFKVCKRGKQIIIHKSNVHLPHSSEERQICWTVIFAGTVFRRDFFSSPSTNQLWNMNCWRWVVCTLGEWYLHDVLRLSGTSLQFCMLWDRTKLQTSFNAIKFYDWSSTVFESKISKKAIITFPFNPTKRDRASGNFLVKNSHR